MTRDSLRQAVNVIAYVAMVVINALANIVPFNGQQTGEISDRFPVFFVPAGYVFSIWGLIYALLLVFTIYQALPSQRANPRLQRIGFLFALSCLWNSVWIFCWHYNLFPLSLVIMLALLATLIVIYRRLDIGREQVSRAEQWLLHVPFSVYLGWITVATIANATDVFYHLGWNGQPLDPAIWAIVMLIVATGLTLLILNQRRDIAYSLVIVWAFVGIFVKQNATPGVAYAAVLGALIVGILALWFTWRGMRNANAAA
jgi:hypothetical protein